jgi:hypothetical protein
MDLGNAKYLIVHGKESMVSIMDFPPKMISKSTRAKDITAIACSANHHNCHLDGNVSVVSGREKELFPVCFYLA